MEVRRRPGPRSTSPFATGGGLAGAQPEDWVPVSRMWALKVTRSTMAATSRGSGNDGAPLGERQVRGDRDRGAFLAFGDDLEQQLGASGVDLDVAELVEQQQVEAAVAGDDPGQAPFVGGFDELVDQLGGGGVADPPALLAGGQAEPDEQVGLFRFRSRRAARRVRRRPCSARRPGGRGWRRDRGAASTLNSASRFSRGNRASAMRRARRRSVRSSTSAASTSAR